MCYKAWNEAKQLSVVYQAFRISVAELAVAPEVLNDALGRGRSSCSASTSTCGVLSPLGDPTWCFVLAMILLLS